MNVLFDHQAFTMQSFGGVSKYFSSLMYYLPEYCNYSLLLKYSDNYYLKQLVNNKYPPFLPGINFKGKKVLTDYVNRYYAKDEAKKINYDIYHPTYYNTFLVRNNKKPLVVTVHDMIHELYPKMVSVFDNSATYKKEIVNKADLIIAVSDNTKKDLVKIYGTDPQKIVIIHHGFAGIDVHEDQTLMFPERYILYVGARYDYKNFINLLISFAQIKKSYAGIKLVAIGGGKFKPAEIELMQQLGIKADCLYFSGLTDNQMNILYRNALLFVYPSKYEGFGFPILEAFYNKCPVVLSDRSSFPEVAGDAAIYFDPDDPNDLAKKIEVALSDEHLRSDLITKGTQRLSLFTWQDSVRKTYEAYKSLI